MGSLFRRKSGRLAGRWVYTRAGHQHLAPETVRTKTQAKAWAAAIEMQGVQLGEHLEHVDVAPDVESTRRLLSCTG